MEKPINVIHPKFAFIIHRIINYEIFASLTLINYSFLFLNLLDACVSQFLCRVNKCECVMVGAPGTVHRHTSNSVEYKRFSPQTENNETRILKSEKR